jgi:hypothetical protein
LSRENVGRAVSTNTNPPILKWDLKTILKREKKKNYDNKTKCRGRIDKIFLR